MGVIIIGTVKDQVKKEQKTGQNINKNITYGNSNTKDSIVEKFFQRKITEQVKSKRKKKGNRPFKNKDLTLIPSQ